MDFFFIEYRDPIFGLIVFFAVIFLIVGLSFLWGVVSKQNDKNKIKNFIAKFERTPNFTSEHENILQNLDTDTLFALAQVFSKNGDFEKVSNIYLIALKNTSKKSHREFIFTALGKSYLKAGFLKRSSEVFLEALKLGPRNTEALRYLIIIYEKLRLYDEALEALISLREHGVDTAVWVAYLKALKILHANIKFDDKIAQIYELSKDFELLKRLNLEQLLLRNEPINEANLPKFEDCVDLIYQRPNLIDKFNESSNSFYLQLFDLAKKQNLRATLSFSYVCAECKSTYPLFFYRCPSCAMLGSAKILSNIVEEKDEESATF